jgi:protein-S-isoprenylcysteine O-methyltransferase Ste14
MATSQHMSPAGCGSILVADAGGTGIARASALPVTVMPKIEIAIVLVLSLAVWVFFKWQTPDAPLSPTEMLVVVVVIGGGVAAVRWAMRRFGKRAPT